MAQDEPQDAAAEAFEALRAEVTQLRAGVERLSGRFPLEGSTDYAPTLGAIAKSLETIEGHPALQADPEAFASQLRNATELSTRQGRQELADAVKRLIAAAAGLERLATRSRTGREQRRVVAISTGVGALAGVLLWVGLSGPIARELPAKWQAPERMAAATLDLDRWAAGERLLRSADIDGWRMVAAASQFEEKYYKELQACRDLAARAGKATRCVVTVAASQK